MSKTESELIELVRAAKDPGKALVASVQVIIDFLKEAQNVR